jgi:tRNA(Ile)-lysidine synthase
MITEFLQNIRSKNLIDPSQKYILAVSGGSDSVCLGYLLKEAKIDFELAHVNYHLRGVESDADEKFVAQLANLWKVKLHVKNGNFKAADFPGMSTQMIAREIRYSWFSALKSQIKAEGILVAHHFEDQIETLFLNLLRGTGIEGMYGMSERKGDIIRPLLTFHKHEILQFLKNNHYQWREDSSNKKSLYTRNYLRNEVIPMIESQFPEGLSGLEKTSQRIKDTGSAFFYFFSEWKKNNILKEGDFEYLEIKSIVNLPGKSSILFYWLRDYGFQFAVIKDLLNAIKSNESGKTFVSFDYLLNLDREHLILGKKEIVQDVKKINIHDIEVKIGGESFDILKLSKQFELDFSSQHAMIDFDKLKFPLQVRPWKLGDKFVPLGMKTQKKISDLLVDLKVPVIKKKQIMVLTSEDEIVWVVGVRISDHFKCDQNTQNVWYLKRHSND